MDDAQPFIEWIIRLVIAAIFSIIGFLSKQIYVDWKAKKNKNKSRLEQLQVLSNLLNESKSIYISQNFMSQRLMQMLRENHPEIPVQQLGYDETFYQLYEQYLPAEAELQSIIRSTTMNSMFRLNKQMSSWLNDDKVFKSKIQPTEERSSLAKDLQYLKLHLNQWQDKYEAVIPEDKRRSLVYLADEKKQGTEFPKSIEQKIEKIIAKCP
ncbi:hypothetical protein [Mariniflexile sp. AS56]|uniref:hypothetical protein n=1 Tax=Mariniflexile sp. AS56 TaxID=3063957 RepID=UPI0026F0CD75|nr:hypothetical protein [Mariniflexile sp. AS56]MDO7174149.1 hypothetical protein [Mariniflexile sp. AS56]